MGELEDMEIEEEMFGGSYRKETMMPEIGVKESLLGFGALFGIGLLILLSKREADKKK